MLENDDSKLQTNIWSAYHFKYFWNNPILKSRDCTNPPPPPRLPNFESLPYPGEGSRFDFFFLAKMRGKDELKATQSNFTPWVRVFEHRGENCLGVLQLPIGELGLNNW